jgi:hypothetical protein
VLRALSRFGRAPRNVAGGGGRERNLTSAVNFPVLKRLARWDFLGYPTNLPSNYDRPNDSNLYAALLSGGIVGRSVLEVMRPVSDRPRRNTLLLVFQNTSCRSAALGSASSTICTCSLIPVGHRRQMRHRGPQLTPSRQRRPLCQSGHARSVIQDRSWSVPTCRGNHIGRCS